MQEAIERVEAHLKSAVEGLEEIVKMAAAEGDMGKVENFVRMRGWVRSNERDLLCLKAEALGLPMPDFGGRVLTQSLVGAATAPAPETQPEGASAPVLEGPG